MVVKNIDVSTFAKNLKWMQFVKAVKENANITHREAMSLAKKYWPDYKNLKPEVEIPKPKNQCRKQCRRVCFTHWDLDLYSQLPDIYDSNRDRIRFIIYQGEMAKTGRKHLQGYMEFYRAFDYSVIKQMLRSNTVHLEPAKADAKKNISYCTKSETSLKDYPPVQRGEPAKKGSRTDLHIIANCIKDGKSLQYITENYPREYIKYSNGIHKLFAMHHSRRRNAYIPNLKVHVIYGDSGAGKTSYVHKRHGHQNVYAPIWNGDKWWFSQYSGQKVLLINEFYGQCRTSVFQNLTDVYRLAVETKGGEVTSNWDTIYITSNCHPKDWYNGYENVPDAVEQSIIRRISSITFLESKKKERYSWDNIKSLSEVEESSITSSTSVTSYKDKPLAAPFLRAKRVKKVTVSPSRYTAFSNYSSSYNLPLENAVQENLSSSQENLSSSTKEKDQKIYVSDSESCC